MTRPEPHSPQTDKPSLRKRLASANGNQVVAYLTLGDPPDRFLEVAREVIEAGALALELGIPHPAPREGGTLIASHQRALDAGVDTTRALELLGELSHSYAEVPLIAVLQWSAIAEDDSQVALLDGLAAEGATAVLPIDVPLGQLSQFAKRADERGLETVLSCFPDTPQRIRHIAQKFCSGCLYVPRSRGPTGSAEAVNVAQFCAQLTTETNLPIIVGFGVESAADVAAICATQAAAAAVGSALVKHVSEGGAAGAFVRSLLSVD